MKNLVFSIALVAVFALCLPAWSAPPIAKWSQPVDTTNALFGEISQTNPVTVPSPGVQDDRAADDWKCTDGTPITKIAWWGDYHRYLDTTSGTVDPPTFLPTSFILRQYSNDATDPSNTKPGAAPIAEVEIPIAKCNQAFVQTVYSPSLDSHIHIFSYQATLDTPWAQTKDTIYWLSIQAKFATNPQEQPFPLPFMNWEWLSTPTADFLGTALVSYDAGATWTNPFSPGKFNLAFELSPLGLTPTPATLTANTQTMLKIVANIPPIARNFVVYLVVMLPNNQMMSFVPAAQAGSGKGALEMNIPCLPVQGLKSLARGTANTIPQGADVTVFDNFVSLTAGTYLLKLGLFDPQQPLRSENDAFILISSEVVVE